MLVTDAALLVEAGAHLRFDRLVVVHCDPGQQLEPPPRPGRSRRAGRPGAHRVADAARREARLRPLRGGHVGLRRGHRPRRGRPRRGAASRSPAGRGSRPERRRNGSSAGSSTARATARAGSAPAVLLAEAAAAGALEMEALARRLVPAAQGPWYRAAEEAEPGRPRRPPRRGARRLGVAPRSRPTRTFLAGGRGLVARLTHTDPAARADACLARPRRAAARRLAAGRPSDVATQALRLAPLATRFGGGAAIRRPRRRCGTRSRCLPATPSARREECARRGGDPELAAALAGLATPPSPSLEAAALREALAAIRPAKVPGACRGR